MPVYNPTALEEVAGFTLGCFSFTFTDLMVTGKCSHACFGHPQFNLVPVIKGGDALLLVLSFVLWYGIKY